MDFSTELGEEEEVHTMSEESQREVSLRLSAIFHVYVFTLGILTVKTISYVYFEARLTVVGFLKSCGKDNSFPGFLRRLRDDSSVAPPLLRYLLNSAQHVVLASDYSADSCKWKNHTSQLTR